LLHAALQAIGLHGVEVGGGGASLVAQLDTPLGSVSLTH